MAIPKIQAGGRWFRQPCSFFNRLAWRSKAARSTRNAVGIGLAALICLVATGASAAPARLLTARFSGGCNTFTITVRGEGVKQPNPIVSYNITLTPRSGEPITIVDSFALTPEKDGRFHKTIEGNWKKFEFTLTDKYTLSGSAILISDLALLHTLAITFTRENLTCGWLPSNRSAR